MHGKDKNAYKILVRKPEGRPRHRWENNTKIDLKKTGCEDVDQIHPVQSRVQWLVFVNMTMNHW